MPTPAFMTLHGERQGLISEGAFTEASVGNTYQKGREDQIMVQALSHGIFVPKGSGAGRRMHKPLIITKTIDKATPLINNALCSGELLLDQIERGEWRLVRPEADYADWVMPERSFDPAIMELMQNPPVQPSRSPTVFRVAHLFLSVEVQQISMKVTGV